jgi:hypothetical protein
MSRGRIDLSERLTIVSASLFRLELVARWCPQLLSSTMSGIPVVVESLATKFRQDVSHFPDQ